jgi:hypothetical protein
MSPSNEDDSDRQKCFFELEDGASNHNGIEVVAATATRKRRSSPQERVDVGQVTALLREELGRVEVRLATMEALLKSISDRVEANQAVKEYYTTLEVARILQKKAYTVREWCRLGRINGEKAHSGRGVDDEWRVSHEELVRIQNEGLLSIEKFSRVSPPPRLPK